MTATDIPAVAVPDDDSGDRWRGLVRDSNDDGSPIDETLPRRREARALLGSLLRPHRLTLAPLALVVVVETLRGFRFRCWCSAASTTAYRRSQSAVRRTRSWSSSPCCVWWC